MTTILATSTSDIVDHILTSLVPVLPILVGLWLQNRKQKERVQDLSGQVGDLHKEIKSPNGSTTGNMVEEVKKDVKEVRRELGRVAVAVGKLELKISPHNRDSATRSRSGDPAPSRAAQPRRTPRRGGSTGGA